ncbi:potassium channel family protein [Draconibacterium halophilum]|uniref:Potassium channel protein n=1 Tax=Draconibacterium halophilum TaxID=2706887 RepID=A0A6C0RB06_9BACT|nr:potassium channel protein [Draconibacterium halophilum]QIA07269.1 potassium channel protein [Draconibacterium halophilum]
MPTSNLQYNKFQAVSSRTLKAGITLLVSILLFGTAGYYYIEDLTLLESLYMTVITISTVGFKHVGHEPTETGMLFTIILIIFSLGSLAYVGSNMARFIFDGELANYIKTYRVDKKIAKLKDHVIIVGYGRNGEQAAMELEENNVKFVVLDKRDNVITRIRQNPNILYIKGDATHEDTLEQAGIQRARALIATTPTDADNVFVVLTARSMNPGLTVISRASELESQMKLKRAGATNVIMPERIGGQRMAKLVHQPDVVEFIEYILLQKSQDVTLEEVSCKNLAQRFVSKSIAELKVRETTGANIIGIKISGARYVFNPDPQMILSRNDQLFVLGNPAQIKRLKEVMESEVAK